MGGQHHPVDIDPKTLDDSRHTWHGFTILLKWGVIVSVVILVILAYAYIPW